MQNRRKIVFFTGAGMSRESGLPVFRGDGGIWETLDADKVASARSWYSGRRADCRERRQAMLDFFNPLRRAIIEHQPNAGHRAIAALEDNYDVTVITQNGDDYHTRAGSHNVIYLHGEALKNTSSANPYNPLPIDMSEPDIHIGDKAPDGSQIRPYVIYFDENIDKRLWHKAVIATVEADYFVVVGSSMLVYPAAALVASVRSGCRLIVIDPGEVKLPENCRHEFLHIARPATEGLIQLRYELFLDEKKL